MAKRDRQYMCAHVHACMHFCACVCERRGRGVEKEEEEKERRQVPPFTPWLGVEWKPEQGINCGAWEGAALGERAVLRRAAV